MSTYSFLITSLIIVLLPGTGVIYTISTGIMQGKKRSVIAAIGCTAGIIPHLVVSIALSSLLMQMNETAYIVLRIAGACYLLHLGIGMIFSQKTSEFEETKTDRDTLSVIRHGIILK